MNTNEKEWFNLINHEYHSNQVAIIIIIGILGVIAIVGFLILFLL